LGEDAKSEVASQSVPAGKIKVIIRAHIRYSGTDTALVVPSFVVPDAASGDPDSRRAKKASGFRVRADARPGMTLTKMQRAFEKAHKVRFGFIDRSQKLVVEAVSVEAIGGGAKLRETSHRTKGSKLPSPARRTRFFSDGQWQKA